MMRRLAFGCAALALACGAHAADDLQPAVNTSAPDRAAAAGRPAANPSAAVVGAVPASSAARQPPLAVVPAATSATTGKPAGSSAGRSSGTRTGGSARDRVELENTQITGNRELPKVMYVVPWKKPDLGDFGGRPAKSLLDELLEPVDRDVFKRQNRYFEALQPDAPAAHSGDEK